MDEENSFPTPEKLRQANKNYILSHKDTPLETDDDGLPLPYPPPTSKSDIFDSKKFRDVDKKIDEVADELLEKPIDEVVKHLMADAEDDLTKVRIIYRFLCGKDLNKLPLQLTSDNTTLLKQLQDLHKGNLEYEDVFGQLCRAADLTVKTIKGIRKLNTRNDDERFSPWSWNVVLIDGIWRLVSPHSRYVAFKKEKRKLIDEDGKGAMDTSEDKVVIFYRLEEHYFLTDPENLISSHFPREEKWQLLAQPIKEIEFFDSAQLFPQFFNLGLTIGNQRRYELHTRDGTVDIKLGLPLIRTYPKYQLWQSDHDAERLERSVIMNQQQRVIHAKIVPPTCGQFRFELFACSDGHDQVKLEVCTYMIRCHHVGNPEPFPINPRPDKLWGPTYDMEDIGLTPITHLTERVTTDDSGIAQIKLKADKKLEFKHELYSESIGKHKLKHFVLQSSEANSELTLVKVPKEGQYVLHILAREKENDGFASICLYLVEASGCHLDSMPLPNVQRGKLGVTPEGQKLGLKLLSHSSPYIECPRNNEDNIILDSTTSCIVNVMLYLDNPKGTRRTDKSKYLLTSMVDNNKINIHVRLPGSGMYILEIDGKEKKGQALMTDLANFIIHSWSESDLCVL